MAKGKNWTASYYNSTDLSGPVVFTEILPNGISINWGTGSPNPAVNPDNFSARFTSKQNFIPAIHEFIISFDAGVRFFIDGKQIFDKSSPGMLTTERVQLQMKGGEHSLAVEYFAAIGQAAIQVQWVPVIEFTETIKFNDESKTETPDKPLTEAIEPVLFGEFRVASLEEMLAQIFPKSGAIVESKPTTPFFWTDAPYYYRGQADSSWGLTPSIFRKIKTEVNADDKESYVNKVSQLEKEIYSDFIDQSRAYLPAWIDRNNRWEMLCVAQHFGVPTRLLDWTSNFLAATYFAVCEKFDQDGAVWCLRGNQFKIREKRQYKDADNIWLRYMRFGLLPDHASFFNDSEDSKSEKGDKAPYFALILPPHIENRIKNQSGIFSVHVSFTEPTTLDDLVYDHAKYLTGTLESVLLKFVIDCKAKELIRERLERMGVDFTHLYPDISGLGKYWTNQRERMFELWSKRY